MLSRWSARLSAGFRSCNLHRSVRSDGIGPNLLTFNSGDTMSSPSPEKPTEPDTPPRPPRKSASGDEPPSRPTSSAPWLFLLIILLVVVLWFYLRNPANKGSRVDYSFFLEEVRQNDNVSEVTFQPPKFLMGRLVSSNILLISVTLPVSQSPIS